LDGPFAAPSSSSGPCHEIWASLPNLTSAQASLPSLLTFPLQYPPPEETKALDARIAVIRQQQEAIETKLADLKRIVGKPQICDDIRDLELIHASLDDDIADVRLIRGPWCPSRIPTEILCEIFHSYLRFIHINFHSSMWTISQVCRAWRRIAFGCPTLWNTLRITSYAIKYSNAYSGRGSMGLDRLVTELQAQRAIRRTREAPLQIELYLNERSQQTGSMLRVLRAVAGQTLARWTSLVWSEPEIGASLAYGLGEVFLPTMEMPSLQHLSLPCKLCVSLLPAHIAAMPSLTSLKIKLEEDDSPAMLMNHQWLVRLKILKLEFYGRGHHQYLGRLGQMVGRCGALEELGLQRGPSYSLPSSESFDSVRWPPLPRGLRTIVLHTHANFWSCISGANITSLALDIDEYPLETLPVAPRSISLPSLTKLKCLSYETAFTAGCLLDAPKVQSMSIYHWMWRSKTVAVYDLFSDKSWGIYPIKVFLQTRDLNRALLRGLFIRLSQTTTLSLSFFLSYGRSVDPLLALIPDLESCGDTVVCPKLHQVEFEFKDTLPNSEVSRIDGIIQAIQDTRGSIGLPRPSVDFRQKGCCFGV
jgi:hypothetical protein